MAYRKLTGVRYEPTCQICGAETFLFYFMRKIQKSKSRWIVWKLMNKIRRKVIFLFHNRTVKTLFSQLNVQAHLTPHKSTTCPIDSIMFLIFHKKITARENGENIKLN